MTTLTLPTAGEMVTGILGYSTTLFSEFLPVIYIPIAIAVVGGALWFLVRNGKGLSKKVFGGGSKRRGRR